MLSKKDIDEILIHKFNEKRRIFKLNLKWYMEEKEYESECFKERATRHKDLMKEYRLEAKCIVYSIKLLRRFSIKVLGKKCLVEMLKKH